MLAQICQKQQGKWERWQDPMEEDLLLELLPIKNLRNSSYCLGEGTTPLWSQGFKTVLKVFKRN